jgi:hypothetical protein
MILKNNSHYSLLCVLLLLALIVRSLIPVGFMPGQTDSGKVQIVICSGYGEQTIYVDKDQAPPGMPDHETSHDQKNKSVCTFSPVVAHATHDFSPFTVALDFEALPVFIPVPALPDTISPKPWFSQGPPVS